MNKNILCMLIYFLAAGFLFGYAFTTQTIFLYLGIASLIIAIITSRTIKKK